MLLAHASTAACDAERQAARAVRQAARKARKAARHELSQTASMVRKLSDGLYDLVDRQARERYEGRRQNG